MSIYSQFKKQLGDFADRACIRQVRRHTPDYFIAMYPDGMQGVSFTVHNTDKYFLGAVHVDTGDAPELTMIQTPLSLDGRPLPISEGIVVQAEGLKSSMLLVPDPSQPDGARQVNVTANTLSRLWNSAGVSLVKDMLFENGVPNNQAIKWNLGVMAAAYQAHKRMEAVFPVLRS